MHKPLHVDICGFLNCGLPHPGFLGGGGGEVTSYKTCPQTWRSFFLSGDAFSVYISEQREVIRSHILQLKWVIVLDEIQFWGGLFKTTWWNQTGYPVCSQTGAKQCRLDISSWDWRPEPALRKPKVSPFRASAAHAGRRWASLLSHGGQVHCSGYHRVKSLDWMFSTVFPI